LKTNSFQWYLEVTLLNLITFDNGITDKFISFIFSSGNVNITKNIIKNNNNNNNLNEFILNVNNKVFTKDLFEKLFNQLWTKIENKFLKDNHMFILLKIKYNNGEFVTIRKLQRLNLADKNWYIDFIIESMKFKSEYYNEIQIDSFVFSYGFKTGKIKIKEVINTNINFMEYNKLNLAVSLNPLNYGKLIKILNIQNEEIYVVQNSLDQIIMISKFSDHNEVEFFKSGISLIKYRDEFTSVNKFIRIIDNKKFYFENNQQVLFTKEIKTKFISNTNKSKNLVNNFITLDIETYIQDNTLIPFLICIYDGKNRLAFGLWDYENVELMILDCLKSILIRKYNGYKIYIHNMAKFDVIFLLKYLIKIANVQPVIHNDRIISLTINYGKDNEYQIQFKDSYLILLSSLSNLTKNFKVENLKTIFPYFFINENNLDYIGNVPDFKFFGNKTDLTDYNEYKSTFNNNWNLKEESVKYCVNDCVSLYQVIFKFNDIIFNLFTINIHNYPTLPSLAFAIFRSNFLIKNTIPQLSGKISEDIRQGYTGGAVDMYIPESKPGIEIKCFDVNALYPSQMQSQLMPIGVPTYFEGDISIIDPNAFGFFYCKIIAPDNIKHPILQTHVKTKSGLRTIAPKGTWNDMLFSSEMNNARKNGYIINILWGYTFESVNIFKDYVDLLHNLRSQYPKSDPMNFIAKILLNSLYGRFGMDDNFPNINIIHKDYYADFENKYLDNIIDKVDLGDYWLVFYISNNSGNDLGSHNVSIAISAAISAYSRIHMSYFKNNPKINLYYSDTDSIYTDSDIDDSFIHNTILGKLKLENTCNKAIFLSPKVYCLETIDNEIIYKVKGLKHEIELTINDFENLLYKDALIKKSQTKWMRNISAGKITLLDSVYTLQVTDNKRKLIYNKNNKLIGTTPYIINEDKEIINK
jgi:DNA polymerase type B, organellar and viral